MTYDDELKHWKRKYEEEVAIVNKCWEAMGMYSYEDAGGKTIYEHIANFVEKANTPRTEALPNAEKVKEQARLYLLGLQMNRWQRRALDLLDAWDAEGARTLIEEFANNQAPMSPQQESKP